MNKLGVTPALGKMLRANPSIYNKMEQAIMAISRDYDAAIAAGARPEDIAFTFHQLIDKEIEKTLGAETGEKPICQRGCAHCCYVEVDITDFEAELLAKLIEHYKIEIDMTRLALQGSVQRWKQLAYKERKCVFLGDDNACRIYDHRPMACRKYFVGRGEPEKCSGEKYPNGQVDVYSIGLVEAIASALYSRQAPGPLPKKLLSKIRIKNETP